MERQVELRPPTLDDLPTLAAFSLRLRELYDVSAPSEAQFRDMLTSTRTKPDENYRVALDRDELAGWVTVWWPKPGADRIIVNLHAHPREPETYVALLEWAEERGRELAAGQRIDVYAG